MTQSNGTVGTTRVHGPEGAGATVGALAPAEVALVRLAAAIAAAGEEAVRLALADALAHTPADWIEEVILQSYLFAGFPRALNAMRDWRRMSDRPAPAHDAGERFASAGDWEAAGTATCATVYGGAYERLRQNIRALHPALDAWMIVEGYGKVLSRPSLDLRRRELCIVAACAAAGQDRQLHAHLHGARNAGASAAQLRAALYAAHDVMQAPHDTASRHSLLLDRVLHHDVH